MRTILLFIAAAITFVAAAITSLVVFRRAPESTTPRLISTTGSAELRVVPDLADLHFNVEVRNPDLILAQQQQAQRAKKVLVALRAAGVTEAELQSSQSQITADYTNGSYQETGKVRFYQVSQSVSCTLHDVKKVPDVTAAAVVAGATGVQEASLRTSQLRKFRDEARVKAIHAAKEKATALATELGAKVGKSYTITEGTGDLSGVPAWSGITRNTNYYYNGQQTERSAVGSDDTTPTFAPGTISISARVSVSFVLE